MLVVHQQAANTLPDGEPSSAVETEDCGDFDEGCFQVAPMSIVDGFPPSPPTDGQPTALPTAVAPPDNLQFAISPNGQAGFGMLVVKLDFTLAAAFVNAAGEIMPSDQFRG